MDVSYEEINDQTKALISGESDMLALAANVVSHWFGALPDINWLGIYVLRGSELVLGPFQGQPACVRIPVGKGVCGTAAAKAETLRVDDVHKFAGHIACDLRSRSEIVVPLSANNLVFAVVDIDSPIEARFSMTDQRGIESLCTTFVERLLELNSELTEFI